MKSASYQNATVHPGDDGSNDGVFESSSVIKNNRLTIFKVLLAIVAASGVAYLAATPLKVRLNSQTFHSFCIIFLNAKLIFWICITL